MKTLLVYWNGRKVGAFTEQERAIRFQYDPAWLAAHGPAISASIPVQAEAVTSSVVARFVENLLPEAQVRDTLLAQFKLDSHDDFGLLEKLGAECAGALAILPEHEAPVDDAAPFEALYSEAMDPYELGQFIQAFAASPTHPFKGQRLRLSLAGVQRKFAIACFDGTLYRTRLGASTHIVKPDIPQVLGTPGQVPGIVFNEYFCGRLATRCRLPAAAVELLPFTLYRDGPPQYAFMSERFDRQVQAQGRVLRLHQEDFCQALGEDRRRKYEEGGEGISLVRLFGFVRNPDHVRVPILAQRALLNGLAFNVLIGNGDAHAKNYSLLRSAAGVEVAPLYDLVSTQVYEAFNNDFAQKIGQARRFADLATADFHQLAETIGIKPRIVLSAFIDLARRAADQAGVLRMEMAAQPYWREAQAVVDRIVEIVRARSARLLHLISGSPAGTTAWDTGLLEPGLDLLAREPSRAGRLLALLADNGGRLAKKDRDNEFPEISDPQTAALESLFAAQHENPA